MDAEFRKRIACVFPARLPVEQLAKAIEETALHILDRNRPNRFEQPEFVELSGGVGKERDANAELLDLGRGFEHGARNVAPFQIECQGKPGNPAADDRNADALGHRPFMLRALVTYFLVCDQASGNAACPIGSDISSK